MGTRSDRSVCDGHVSGGSAFCGMIRPDVEVINQSGNGSHNAGEHTGSHGIERGGGKLCARRRKETGCIKDQTEREEADWRNSVIIFLAGFTLGNRGT